MIMGYFSGASQKIGEGTKKINNTVSKLPGGKKVTGKTDKELSRSYSKPLKKGAMGVSEAMKNNKGKNTNFSPMTPPAFVPIMSKTGNLNDNFVLPGASPWLRIQEQKNALETQNAMNQAAQSVAAGNAMAQSQLAMGGGLRAGAAERIAKAGNKDLMLARQGVLNQGNLNNMNLQSDAFDKTQAARQFNIGTRLGQTTQERLHNMGVYNEQMRAWAAGKQGNAISKSGGK